MSIKHLGYSVLTSRPFVFGTNLFVSRFKRGIISHGGNKIDTNNAAVTPWVRTLVYWNLYETAELRLIRQYLPADLDIVELGGSIGVVATHIARRLQPGKQLVSVEANPKIVDLLRSNITRNGPHVRATIIHGAIAYLAGDVDHINITFGDSTLASWLSKPNDSSTESVPVTRLSELLVQHGIDQFALVADIEGAEAGILLRDQEALMRCHILIIELHDTQFEGRNISIADLLKMATELGFVCVDHHRSVYVLKNRNFMK